MIEKKEFRFRPIRVEKFDLVDRLIVNILSIHLGTGVDAQNAKVSAFRENLQYFIIQNQLNNIYFYTYSLNISRLGHEPLIRKCKRSSVLNK